MRALLLFAMVLVGSSTRADVINITWTGPLGTPTGAVVDYTVPVTGAYFIRAAGAMGSEAYHHEEGFFILGGLGAVVGGVVDLTAGEQLGIVAGGVGEDGGACPFVCGGGGGGGSFVFVLGATNPLIAAGGGGGAGEFGGSGGDGQTSTAGQAGFGPAGGSGGAAGAGGASGFAGGDNGGGGGGWSGDGGNGVGDSTRAGLGGSGAFTFAGGPGGPLPDRLTTFGGFGGGGGGGFGGGGGGGGYSGGGGGDGYYSDGGGGGGSYLDASFTDPTLQPGANAGDGYVDLKLVPEPSSLPLLGTILLLGAVVTVKRNLPISSRR